MKACDRSNGQSCTPELIAVLCISFFQLVDSETGPGFDLRNALWHSGDVKGQASGH